MPRPSEPAVVFIKNMTREGPGRFETLARAWNVPYWIVDLEHEEKLPEPEDCRGVVMLGGTASANDQTWLMAEEISLVSRCLDTGVPYLGICLGMQILARAAGATVQKHVLREIGVQAPDRRPWGMLPTKPGYADPIMEGIQETFPPSRAGVSPYIPVFQLHGETVVPNERTELLASGVFCTQQMIRVGRKAWGIQGHIEIDQDQLDTWSKEDPFLRQQDRISLMRDFSMVQDSYAKASELIFGNFLRVAGLKA